MKLHKAVELAVLSHESNYPESVVYSVSAVAFADGRVEVELNASHFSVPLPFVYSGSDETGLEAAAVELWSKEARKGKEAT
jgi:hypothetical protein